MVVMYIKTRSFETHVGPFDTLEDALAWRRTHVRGVDFAVRTFHLDGPDELASRLNRVVERAREDRP